MEKISHSRVQCYLSCPYSHYLRYVERLRKKTKSRPLSFGSDFHKLLEVRIKGKSAVKQAFTEIKEQYYNLPSTSQIELGDDYLDCLKEIFVDYMKIYQNDAKPDVTEQTFDIPIFRYKGEDVLFTGVIDEIYFKDSGVVIGEHKTFNRKPDLLTIAMNTQKCLYAKATQLLTGSLPREVIWDYIKSTPAQEPIWLEKSGRFSEAKNTNITQFSWERACKKRGVEDLTVINKKFAYTGNLPNFFFKLTEEYIPEMVEDIWQSWLYTAKDIMRQGSKNKTKHTGQNCSWCDYRQICYAELTGGNVEYTKEQDFEVHEREEQEENKC